MCFAVLNRPTCPELLTCLLGTHTKQNAEKAKTDDDDNDDNGLAPLIAFVVVCLLTQKVGRQAWTVCTVSDSIRVAIERIERIGEEKAGD